MIDPIITEDVDRIAHALGSVADPLSGKTVLITGANGFLPSYFVDALVQLNETTLARKPAKIIVMVRRAIRTEDRLGHLIGNPSVQFVIQDVTEPLQSAETINYIVHAASPAAPRAFLANPLETIDANVAGTRALLEYATRHPIEGFLFLSSGETYGDPDLVHIPIREEYHGNVDPLGPRASYQESKRFGETLCAVFAKHYRVPAVIARLFHTYGPRLTLTDGRVIPEFMRRALSGEEISVTDERATRTFGYISDMIEGLWRVLLLGESGAAYNVASEEEISIGDLAARFVQLFPNTVRIRRVEPSTLPHLVGTPQRTTPNIEKLKALGYAEKISLREGLERLKRWCEQ